MKFSAVFCAFLTGLSCSFSVAFKSFAETPTPIITLMVHPEAVADKNKESALYLYSSQKLEYLGFVINGISYFTTLTKDPVVPPHVAVYKSDKTIKLGDFTSFEAHLETTDGSFSWVERFSNEATEKGRLKSLEINFPVPPQMKLTRFAITNPSSTMSTTTNQSTTSGSAQFYHHPNGTFADCWDFAMKAVGGSFGPKIASGSQLGQFNLQPGNVIHLMGKRFNHYIVIESVSGGMMTTLESNYGGNTSVVRRTISIHHYNSKAGSVTQYQGTAGR